MDDLVEVRTPTEESADAPDGKRPRVAEGSVPSESFADTCFSASVVPELVCPIEQSIVFDPVVAADGAVYERRAIEEWFDCPTSKDGDSNCVRSPFTGAPLAHTHLVAVPAFKSIVAHLMRLRLVPRDLREPWEQKRDELLELERQRKKAATGDLDAVYHMGTYHDQRSHNKRLSKEARNREKRIAVSWFETGAKRKGVKSMACYGNALAYGIGTARNATMGVYLLMRAASRSSDLACFVLGMAAAGVKEWAIQGYQPDDHDARIFLETLFAIHEGEAAFPGRLPPARPGAAQPPRLYKHLKKELLVKAKETLNKLPPFAPALTAGAAS